VNRVGAKGELVFWGGSQLVDPGGRTVAEASLYTEELVTADVGLADVALPPPRDALAREPEARPPAAGTGPPDDEPRGGGSAGLAAARLGS
jgi:predicted amidohydrolase